jgi:hypothetical protein
MTILLPILFTGALAPGLNLETDLALLGLLAVMSGIGSVSSRALGVRDDPFLAFVAGFVILSHALLAADLVVAGAHWQMAAALGLIGLISLRYRTNPSWRAVAGVGLAVALFTLGWSADIAPRLRQFYSTGVFPFWLDGLVHAGTLAQMASPDAIGRGMILMADTPRPLYHLASYMPPALLARLTGMSPLDATMLVWLPLGVLVMAAGVASLGIALGGPLLATLALAALALVPDPARFFLGNGFLGFAWLLETGPGTGYALGVSCAAVAALVRWMRDPRPGTLALATALTAGCCLVRFNIFLWLAPLMVLAAVAGWRRPSHRLRVAGVLFGLLGLVGGMIALSWPTLHADPANFLFGYIEWVLQWQTPTLHDGLYRALLSELGRTGAALAGVGLILLGTLGPWLPAFAVLSLLVLWFRRPATSNAWPALLLPTLLLAVAAISILLAPNARQGDISEYRHRAGPLLVVVFAVCTLRLAAIVAAPFIKRLSWRVTTVPVMAVAVLAFIVQYATIGAAKQPRMAWGKDFYGTPTAPALLALAPLLHTGPPGPRRFVVADQPADTRNIDDAARLVALSGVPAYLSCPGFLIATGGRWGEEAKRRLATIARLSAAPDLDTLQAEMRAADITDYVVTKPQDLPFDADRHGAVGHRGSYAVYQAQ